MPFSPISSLNSKYYPRNIKYMPAVIFRICLDLNENIYCRTASRVIRQSPVDVGTYRATFTSLLAPNRYVANALTLVNVLSILSQIRSNRLTS